MGEPIRDNLKPSKAKEGLSTCEMIGSYRSGYFSMEDLPFCAYSLW